MGGTSVRLGPIVKDTLNGFRQMVATLVAETPQTGAPSTSQTRAPSTDNDRKILAELIVD